MCRAVIAIRVVNQILLVVVISREKVLRLPDLQLSSNLLSLGIKVFLLHLLRHLFCGIELVLIVCKDGRTVLCASIVTLLVELRRIVRAVEELDQLGVRYLRGVVLDLCCLSVTRSSGADFFVGRVLARFASTNEADFSIEEALAVAVGFAVDVFGTPETTGSDSGSLLSSRHVGKG